MYLNTSQLSLKGPIKIKLKKKKDSKHFFKKKTEKNFFLVFSYLFNKNFLYDNMITINIFTNSQYSCHNNCNN